LNTDTIFDHNWKSEIQSIPLQLFFETSIRLDLLREDKIHPFVSGNKFRKLKYNIKEVISGGFDNIITFGGAYSNHIAAVAAAGKLAGIQTIGVIRGEELATKVESNQTLQFAKAQGMHLHFVSRDQYRAKKSGEFTAELKSLYGRSYMLPEGGTNELAVKGCSEIILDEYIAYDYLCASVGTGGTLAGLVVSSKENQYCVGYSALKGVFQSSEIQNYTAKTNFKIIDNYCFGGYAKIDSELVRFINRFKEETDIPLDPVYTGKLLYGIFDGIQTGFFKQNSRILAIHTGGLQGISGMNSVLKKKNLPQIE
jgi:1-aminocyclopropane-1-carboxylate deaminase